MPLSAMISPLVAFFLCLQAPVSAFMVPKEIGAPSMRHSSDSWLKSPLSTTTLADAAADAAANKSRAISLGAADASQRPLNLDFIPRVGWTGTVFPSVASPVLCSIAVSVATLWAHETQGFSGIGTTGHTILGVLVSFLAVFRTQQAYARYWEGRGHLGLLMAGLVDVASIASVQFSGEKPELAAAARAELARLLRLYFRETVKFLRKTSRTTQRVSNYWLPADASFSTEQYAAMECDVDATESECEELASVPRPPILVLQWVRAHLYRAGVEGGLLAGSDASERTRTLELGVGPVLGRLQPEFNGCAKIATTPAPQPYTQMGRWLVFWFVYTVPLALIGTFERNPIAVVPASVLLSFGYYGLDYCANQLQNPFIAEFGDVQLDGRFTQAVTSDVDVLLGLRSDDE